MSTLLLFAIFVILLIFNVPVAISLCISSIVTLALTTDFNIYMIAQKMFSSLDSMTLMAIPGFILAGVIMANGGISKYMIAALRSWVGHFRGGLAVVTIGACVIFAAISGSSPATAAAIGGILIPAMVKGGYGKNYSMGLVASSGSLGILIPPSISFVLIGVAASLSIGKLFMAGFLPGLFLGLCLIIVAIIQARKNNYGGDPKATWSERWKSTWKAIPGILMPVIILGSIYGGIATPTESSIIAVFYSLFVSILIYREMDWSKFKLIMRESIGISSMIFLIIPAANVFGLFLTSEQVPQAVVNWATTANLSIPMFWLITQGMFLVMGTFLDAVAIILITIPILMPVITLLGVNPIHFAVVMVVNMQIAMITPPVGLNLFVVSGIAKSRLEDVVRGVLPFMLVLFVCMIILIFFPQISLWLPSMMK